MSLKFILVHFKGFKTTNIAKNPVDYRRTKYIDVNHHLNRDIVKNKDVEMNF